MDKIIEEEKLSDTFIYLDNVTIAGKTQAEHDENVKKFLEVADRRKLTLNKTKTVSMVWQLKVLGYQVSHGCI